MEFYDDIPIGNVAAADLGDEPPGRQEGDGLSSNKQYLAIGLAVSVLLHSLMATVLFDLLIGTAEIGPESIPALVQIQLVSESVAEPVAEPEAEPEVQLDEEIESAALANNERSVDEEQLPQEVTGEPAAAEELTLSLASEPVPRDSIESLQVEQSPTFLTLPSVAVIQQTIEVMESDRRSRFYAYNCNPLEEEAGIRECEPIDDRDFTPLERNPVYEFHNPVVQRSRSRETLNTIARESAALAARLSLSDVPAGLSAYVLEELEQSIELYSNNGNRALAHMNSMVDRSAAAVYMERIYDPWVQNQTRILRERKYYNRQELQELNKCLPIIKVLLLPPDEMLKCLDVGSNPSTLLQLLLL